MNNCLITENKSERCCFSVVFVENYMLVVKTHNDELSAKRNSVFQKLLFFFFSEVNCGYLIVGVVSCDALRATAVLRMSTEQSARST